MNDISPNMHVLYHLLFPAVSRMITMLAPLTLFCKCVQKLLCESEYIPVYSNGTIVPSQSPQAKWLIQTVYYSSHAVLFLQLSKLGICRKDFSDLINATEKKSVRFTEPLRSLFAIRIMVISFSLLMRIYQIYQAINN